MVATESGADAEHSRVRRAHKKSRAGCLLCKARHVRCDEQKPNCARCVKKGKACEYRPAKQHTTQDIFNDLSLNNLASPADALTPSSSTTLEPTSSAASISPDLLLEVSQMRLLHHFTVATAKTLVTNASAEEYMSVNVVRLAFDYSYLLHAILALAALHISRTEVEPDAYRAKHAELAIRHHDASLRGFQAAVHDIDESNFKVVLIFAALLFPSTCAASVSSSKDWECVLNTLIFNMVLTRRARPMVSKFLQDIMSSDLIRIIPDDVKDGGWETKPLPLETELIQLRKFSEVIQPLFPQDIVDAYKSAIHLLELVFDTAAHSQNSPSDALLKIFIHVVPERYMELLSSRQPGSLIIFAHYAVLLHRSPKYWYLEGLADQILNVADAFVPAEWQSWLEWPKAQLRRTPGLVQWVDRSSETLG